jgi:hypothetical protein
VVDLTLIVTLHAEGLLAHPTFRSVARAVSFAEHEGLSVELLLVLDAADGPTIDVVERAMAAGGTFSTLTAVRRLDVSVRDLGLARNAGVQDSSSRFVGVFDGDDLMSANWLSGAVDLLKLQPSPAVVHPGFQRGFGTEGGNRALVGSDDPTFRPDTLVEINWWTAHAIAHREVFESHPYAPNRPDLQLGPEDWHWNIETLGSGISHLVARGTGLYYRFKRVGSLAKAHDAARSLLPVAPMLRSREIAEVAESAGRFRYGLPGRSLNVDELREVLLAAAFGNSKAPHLLPSGHVDVGKLAQRRKLTRKQRRELQPDRFNAVDYKLLHADLHRLKLPALLTHYLDRGRAEGRRALLDDDELAALLEAGFDPDAYPAIYRDLAHLGPAQAVSHFLARGRFEGRRASFGDNEWTRMQESLPDSLIEDWRETHRIEPALPMPTPDVLAAKWGWISRSGWGASSHAYWRCIARLPENVDALILVPSWSIDDIRSQAVRHLRALEQSSPTHVAAVLVLDTDETGAQDGPVTGDIAPIAVFKHDRAELTVNQQEHLVATLIQQMQPRIVHAFESDMAFNTFEVYGRVLKQNSALFASIGGITKGSAGDLISPVTGRHPDFFTSMTTIIAANSNEIDELTSITGADQGLFAPATELDIQELPHYLPTATHN